ncbi:hypothetical protein IIO_04796 [Bacillus cereus VD115]|nr:hypothetical protein IIO_04796 [Bacillus cereus VD115]
MSFKKTELGNIPIEWGVETIENVLEEIIDYRGKTPKKANEGIETLSAKSVKNGYIDYSNAYYISPKTYKEFMVRGFPKKDDILLTTEAPLGNVAKLNKDNVAIAQRLLTLRGKENYMTNEYLMYYLMSVIGQHQLHSRATGTTVTGIKQSEFRKIFITVPTFHEQKSIANILSSLDEKIETNNQINKKLEEMAQAIYKQWFVDFEFPNEDGEPYKSSGGAMVESELGMIPEGWECSKATDQFIVQSGGTPKTSVTEYWNGEIPFFTPKDSHVPSVFVIDTEKNITQEGLSKCNSKLYDAGTVFITARGTVGQVAMAGRKMAMNQSCYALVPNDGFTYNYVYFLTLHLVKILKMNASGSVFNAITVSTFANIKTIMPSRAVVRKFDVIIKSLFSLILNNANENKQLRIMRDTLLPKLMSGEVRVPIK